jgi:hypothetical protein
MSVTRVESLGFVRGSAVHVAWVQKPGFWVNVYVCNAAVIKFEVVVGIESPFSASTAKSGWL